MIVPTGHEVDAWLDVIPEDPYAPCPCGCGKKWKFVKAEPEEHENRFYEKRKNEHKAKA